MRLPVIGVAVLGLAACFSKPGFRGAADDGGPPNETGVPGTIPSVAFTGHGVADPITITTDELEMVIPSTSTGNLSFPTSLKLGGTEVFGRATLCGDEDRAGVAIYPAASATANLSLWPNPATAPTSVPTVTAPGPAFVRVSMAWSGGQYACGGTQQASGNSAFTVFPDGRIIRDDTIDPVSTSLPSSSTSNTCGCGNSNMGYFLTSFISLQNSAFSRAVYENEGSAITLDPLPADIVENVSTDGDNPEWACFEKRVGADSVRRIGVVWTQPQGGQDNGTRMKGNNQNVTTLIYDWVYGGGTITIGPRSTQTAWFTNAGVDATCDTAGMNALRKSFTAPRRMSIGTTTALGALITLDPTTGIYHPAASTASSTWFVGVESQAIDGVAPGFALSLRFPNTAEPHVTRDGVTLINGTDYRYQSDGSTTPITHSWWFPTGLGTTQVLEFVQP